MPRPSVLLSLVLLALAAGAAPAQAACADEDLSTSSGETERLRAAVVCLINEERTARGVPALVRDERIDRAAQLHSEDMDRRGYYDHRTMEGDSPFGPNGATHCARLQSQGYDDCNNTTEVLSVAETPLSAVRVWLSSADGHCAATLQGAAREVGAGISGGKWTVVYGARNAETTGVTCPDKLVREGGGTQLPSLEPNRPTVGRTSVSIPLRCHKLGADCEIRAVVRRGGKVEQRRKLLMRNGTSTRLVVKLSKAGLRQLRRRGRATINVEFSVKGIDEVYYSRNFVLRG